MHGVLPSQTLAQLIRAKHIIIPDGEHRIQPNSIDLPLGKRCWRLRSIRLPRPNETVHDIITELAIEELDLSTPRIIDRNAVYIAELDATLALPADIHGSCDSKSSIGRIDVQTRVLVDHMERYDHIPAGYKGKLYLFISSNSFLIRIHPGLCMNQLRLAIGNTVCTDSEAEALVVAEKLFYVDGKPLADVQTHNGVFMRLDLHQAIGGYRAKFTNAVVDLGKLDNPKEEFWETIPGNVDSITLERNQFYILSTLEHIRIPPTHCGWLPPFRPEFGEFRSHYAGFFDSGFGYGTGDLTGATITLEVRSHDNSLTLLHGQPISPVVLLKMNEKTEKLYNVHMQSNYQSQSGPKLSKFFK
jgi:dCTP deaminase